MTISARQRFTRDRPCPVCTGYKEAPRKRGIRCFGFRSEDGRWGHCSRPEYAGELEANAGSNTYAHLLVGECRCGVNHGSQLQQPQITGANGNGGHIAATYDYCDEGGQLLFQSVRYQPKGFTQRRPDGPHPLYRLPELLAAAAAAIYLPEGEKDADRLRSLGMVATTTVMGAGNAKPT